ncbi:aspartate--tRNA ligase [Candidatus Woesearchaeota archaeon]|nr:aspartate--tRNA ligase [Candidatus Woesearchaeota archaeon]
MLRTHTCGQLTKKYVDAEVTLAGWVNSRRDHGGIIFIDLRDRFGLTQVVFDPNHNKQSHTIAEKLRREWVIQTAGHVRLRGEGLTNTKLPTGEIEVITDTINVLNESEVPPLEIEDRSEAAEDMRLKYRYLDLRRPMMQHKILARHNAAQAVRDYLSSQNFLEVETPLLVKTTPGGARVFKVPSRVHTGLFYSLPESPQLYKQLLMVAGVDRYFQLARCLRDEDLRADRQPEFTQIDLELSFVDEKDVQTVVEGMITHVFKKVLNVDVKTPFQRISYYDAMSKFGSDKPDLRFGLELVDVSDVVQHSDFSVFTSALDKKGIVTCLNAVDCGKFSRTDIEALIEVAKVHHVQGLAWAKVTKTGLDSSITKYLNKDVQEKLISKMKAKDGDLLLFVAEQFKTAVTALGAVRLELAKKLSLIKENDFKFCWVVDFPLFEFNDETQRWDATHHIFTMPKEEDIQYLEEDPGRVRAKLYDVVLNGTELGGGSIRIHRKDIQIRTLKVLGIDYEEAEKRFDFLLNAFKYGAPPHGGIALGFDRLVTVMLGLNDIREVIAFPKNKEMQNPMDNSPQEWTAEFLKELRLKVDVVKKSK